MPKPLSQLAVGMGRIVALASAPADLITRAARMAAAAFAVAGLACGTPGPAAARPPTTLEPRSVPTQDGERPSPVSRTSAHAGPRPQPPATAGRPARDCIAPAVVDPDGVRWNEAKIGESGERASWFRTSARLETPVALDSRVLVTGVVPVLVTKCVAQVAPSASLEMHELRARLDVGTDGLVLDIGFESLPLSLNAHERRILTHCTGRVLAKLELGCSEQPFGRSVAVSYRVRRERSAREPDSVEEPPGTPAGADCPSPAQPDHEGTLGGVYVMRAGKGTLPAMRVTAALAEPAAIREGMLWGSSAATLIATCAATYLPTDGEISLKAKLSADRRGRVKSFAIERESFALAQESALAITACARDGFEQLDLGCSTRKLRNVTVTYKVTRLPPD